MDPPRYRTYNPEHNLLQEREQTFRQLEQACVATRPRS